MSKIKDLSEEKEVDINLSFDGRKLRLVYGKGGDGTVILLARIEDWT